MVVPGATAHEIAVDHGGRIDVDAAGHLEIEPALRHRRHPPPPDAVGIGGHLHAVADAGDGLAGGEEVPRDAGEVGVVADVFRGAAAAEEDAEKILGIDLGEGEVGREPVALPLLRDRPAIADFVHHHLILATLGRDHHRLEACLLQPQMGVKRVDRLGRIADHDQDAAAARAAVVGGRSHVRNPRGQSGTWSIGGRAGDEFSTVKSQVNPGDESRHSGLMTLSFSFFTAAVQPGIRRE